MLGRFFQRFHHSFRYKLLLLVLLPLLVFVPLIMVFSLQRTYTFAETQLYHKVHTNINVASASFFRQQDKFLQAVTRLAESHAFYMAMREQDNRRIRNQLQLLKLTEGFDFVHVVDLKGSWLYEESVFTGETRQSALIEDVIHSGQPKVGLEVYSSAYLLREHQDLVNQARIAIPSSVKPHELAATEQHALVMRAVYPIKNTRGQTIAMLEAGVVLNNNAALVNAVHELVYGPGTLPEQGKGLISVILGNLRISTNHVAVNKGQRQFVGSPVPIQVQRKVLEHGQSWVGEVTTPDGIYLSAYQPLRDYQDNVIGMLESGYLVAPLKQAYLHDLSLFGMLLLLIVIIAAAIAILGARRIFKPIERIAEVIRAQESGHDLRIGNLTSRDEIGALARRFDRMLDLLHERNAEIQRAADNLENQVAERTLELQLKNIYLTNTIELLKKTRHQLVMSEKFAALGELTAGIAHEINNPVAVILGNMDILMEELADATAPVTTEVALIYEQVNRIRTIVEKLLKYSRASPVTLNLQRVDVNKLIDDSILLVRHEVERKQASIVTDLSAGCQVKIDPQELQQIVINLLINAIHAIDNNGTIEITTQLEPDGGVTIRIRDDGAGIEPAVLDRIFDPFYSTKGSQGTGLGLSVSYGLVQRYAGKLEVSSRPAMGSIFTVRLRKEPNIPAQMHGMFDLYSHAGRGKAING